MKIKEPKNRNYCVTVVEIKTLLPLDNCDNVQAAVIMGNQVVVSKTVKIGDIGLFFPVETQLSKEYLSANNLYRKDLKLNSDPESRGGFFELNGRIRCQKFRGHKSEGLFMPHSSIAFTNSNPLNVGDEFDELNGISICQKYIVKTSKTSGQPRTKQTRNIKKKYESKLIDNQFKFHIDTNMLYKNLHRISPDDLIQITYKLHGTSGISSYVLCKRPLKLYEKILKWIKVSIRDTEYNYLYSSRKVIKNKELLKEKTFEKHYESLSTSSKKRYIEKYYREKYKINISTELYRDIFPLGNIGNSLFTLEYFESKLEGFTEYLKKELNYKSKGYYGEDIWELAHKQLEPFLQKGMTLYYEIVGYLPSGGMIQKDYDYGQEPGTFKVYIYRITQTNYDGKVFEFSGRQVQEWCKKNGLNAVPELFYGHAKEFSDNISIKMGTSDLGGNDLLCKVNKEFNSDEFLNRIKQFYNEKQCFMCKNPVPEEGVVIRIEGLEIEAYKQKSTAFYERETKLLDKGESDIENEN